MTIIFFGDVGEAIGPWRIEEATGSGDIGEAIGSEDIGEATASETIRKATGFEIVEEAISSKTIVEARKGTEGVLIEKVVRDSIWRTRKEIIGDSVGTCTRIEGGGWTGDRGGFMVHHGYHQVLESFKTPSYHIASTPLCITNNNNKEINKNLRVVMIIISVNIV